MDVELARTFLEVMTARSFSAAAERLNITQTAISARIRNLEEQLGRPVFIRNKSGATLTPAGQSFAPYAANLVQTWAKARAEISVPAGHTSMLSVGGEHALWNPLLLDWLIWMRRHASEIAIRSYVDQAECLLDHVQNGQIDMAVLYAPPHRSGFEVELLLEEQLIAVSTNPETRHVHDEDYVQVDWGPDFQLQYDRAFPAGHATGPYIGLGPLALNYILTVGGSGYFRKRAVAPYLTSGLLYRKPNDPEFSYSVYAIYSSKSFSTALQKPLEGFRHATTYPSQMWVGSSVTDHTS